MNNPVDQPKVSGLLPCPHCGGQAALYHGDDGYTVECKFCFCCSTERDAEIDAVAAWNCRVALPQPQATTVGVKALEWYGECASSLASALNGASVGDALNSGSSNKVEAILVELSLDAGRRAALAMQTNPSSVLIGIPGAEKGEAVGWQRRLKKEDANGCPAGTWSAWKECSAEQASYALEYGTVDGFPDYLKAEARPIYAAPTSERVQALADLEGAWSQFINCRSDQTGDKAYDDAEEQRNVMALARAIAALNHKSS